MNRFLKSFILLISILCLSGIRFKAEAQSLLPASDGDVATFSSFIEMPKGYISGVCAMMLDNGMIKATVFNEFGITALDFVYNLKKQKVKLEYVIKMLDKWYIKRVMKNDLVMLIKCLNTGNTEYVNAKRKITYRFVPMEDNKLTSDNEYEAQK